MTTHPDIRARLEAATPGDWYALPSHVVEGNAQVRVKTAKEDYLLCELPSDAVAGLIAHAPTDLATLLAENEALRAQVETAEAGLREIHGHLGAAIVQRAPSDDAIIAEHIECADKVALITIRALKALSP